MGKTRSSRSTGLRPQLKPFNMKGSEIMGDRKAPNPPPAVQLFRRWRRRGRWLLALRDAEITELRALVYVPGLWRCEKCEFQLLSNEMDANTGRMRPNNTPQVCANGCGTMSRVTERDAGNRLCDRLDPLQEELAELKAWRERVTVALKRERILYHDVPRIVGELVKQEGVQAAQTVQAVQTDSGGRLEEFAARYPCNCAQRYPGSREYHNHYPCHCAQQYHGDGCETKVVQEFVAQFIRGVG
jgi:hypothetical protein